MFSFFSDFVKRSSAAEALAEVPEVVMGRQFNIGKILSVLDDPAMLALNQKMNEDLREEKHKEADMTKLAPNTAKLGALNVYAQLGIIKNAEEYSHWLEKISADVIDLETERQAREMWGSRWRKNLATGALPEATERGITPEAGRMPGSEIEKILQETAAKNNRFWPRVGRAAAFAAPVVAAGGVAALLARALRNRELKTAEAAPVHVKAKKPPQAMGLPKVPTIAPLKPPRQNTPGVGISAPSSIVTNLGKTSVASDLDTPTVAMGLGGGILGGIHGLHKGVLQNPEAAKQLAPIHNRISQALSQWKNIQHPEQRIAFHKAHVAPMLEEYMRRARPIHARGLLGLGLGTAGGLGLGALVQRYRHNQD